MQKGKSNKLKGINILSSFKAPLLLAIIITLSIKYIKVINKVLS